MAFEKYTISEFMKAWFNQDYSSISKEEFETVYTEYIDMTGLYISEEFEKISYIKFLQSRINSARIFVEFQKKFIDEYAYPYMLSINFPKEKYGYSIRWNGSTADFLNQLESFINSQSTDVVNLDIAISELEKIRQQRPKDKKDKPKRESFIRTLNSLGKIGYNIDKNSTTVEELAIMIKQQLEESERIQNS